MKKQKTNAQAAETQNIPVEQNSPAEKEAPVVQETPAAKEAPVVQETPAAKEAPVAQDSPVADNAAAEQLRELSVALVEAQTKLALLMNGASCSSLEEGARFALGLVGVGMAPEDAAQRTMEVYPHLRLTKRELPVFSAETKGSDGFAAIRSIFARC